MNFQMDSFYPCSNKQFLFRLSNTLIVGPHLSGLELLGHSVTVGKFTSSMGWFIDSEVEMVRFSSQARGEKSLIYPPVYLHSIFEISSVTRIFFNFKISSLKNWKINLISKLIFAGYTGSRNQVQTRKKIKLVLNSIFFQVWNKLRNPKFENRVQRDRA